MPIVLCLVKYKCVSAIIAKYTQNPHENFTAVLKDPLWSDSDLQNNVFMGIIDCVFVWPSSRSHTIAVSTGAERGNGDMSEVQHIFTICRRHSGLESWEATYSYKYAHKITPEINTKAHHNHSLSTGLGGRRQHSTLVGNCT